MLKNREVRKFIILVILVTAVVCGVVYLFHIPAVISVSAAALIFLIIWFIDMKMRYAHMEKLAREIDMILHGNGGSMLSEYEEGDISILRNEISKMTIMLKQQAEQLGSEKLKLADSLADISHQIRTPLTSLNLMLEALKKEENEERRSRLIFDMRRQLERIDALVVSLLKLAKMDAGTIKLQKTQVKLDELVQASLVPLEIMMELKGITAKVDVNGGFTGDSEWSREALSNILKNCMEHTAAGGTISISGYENAVHTELVIEDSGSGMEPDDIPHIFERFYKGKNNKSDSYGIGLALARSIITEQNGTIKAENVVDADGNICGARFKVKFYKGII